MSTSTAGSAARGGAVTLLGQAAKVALQVVSVVVLTRLLEPGDFGLIAMIAVFVGVGELLRDFGIPTAALSAPRLTEQQQSNLFWIGLGLGVVTGLGLLVATPAIVGLYGEPELWHLVPALSVVLLINGAQAQYQVVLARSRRFTSLVVTDLLAQVLGLLAAVVGAIGGIGYWALALQLIVQAVALLALRALVSRWRPGLPRRDKATAEIVKKGIGFGGAQFLTYAAANVDSLVIGARWGSSPLGFYNRAFQLIAMPGNAIARPLMNVVIPTINRAREAGRSVDSVLLRAQGALGMLVVWVFAAGAASASYLIPLLFGPGWDLSITLFQILAIGGAVQVFSTVSYWGFVAHQKARSLFLYNLVSKTMTVAMIVGASFLGLKYVAFAYSLALVLSWPLNLVWLWRVAQQPSLEYFLNGLRFLIAGAGAYGGAVAIATALPTMTNVLGSLVMLSIATALYFGIIAILPGGRARFQGAVQMLKSMRPGA